MNGHALQDFGKYGCESEKSFPLELLPVSCQRCSLYRSSILGAKPYVIVMGCNRFNVFAPLLERLEVSVIVSKEFCHPLALVMHLEGGKDLIIVAQHVAQLRIVRAEIIGNGRIESIGNPCPHLCKEYRLPV